MSKGELKQFPVFATDEEAERFVDTADLSEYDFSGFKPKHFEFERKSARLDVDVPKTLIQALKKKAEERGVPYERLIVEALESAAAGR